MYHRIDGKLVAVGIIDITTNVMNSAYFIYDPDYSFLNLGVVGAIVEMEYMRMVREKFKLSLKWYHLGELVVTCPKVNYKMNYQPSYILCPYTKKWIPQE
jgi:arginine-tRNA-protein transferase